MDSHDYFVLILCKASILERIAFIYQSTSPPSPPAPPRLTLNIDKSHFFASFLHYSYRFYPSQLTAYCSLDRLLENATTINNANWFPPDCSVSIHCFAKKICIVIVKFNLMKS